MKLGSLFDGSGGFPLAGSLSGLTPAWASEVEPWPIRVTTKRFPSMKHLGDISKINGAEIEPVDVITFGSPCQDLSVAGQRKGLKHDGLGDEETTRSGLFMEAVRIIKEMRCKTNGRYPTFAVWENVPGAYSSNKGEDFRAVLEELAKVKEKSVSIPKSTKWLLAGEIVGDGYSIAWRTLNAQYWGVPQRRRRIYLVADFRGGRAGKILFERTGLRGDIAESGTQGQGVARNAENSITTDDREGKCVGFDGYNSCLTGDKSSTLGINCGMSTGRNGVICKAENPILTAELGIASRDGGHCYENIAGTLRANEATYPLTSVERELIEGVVTAEAENQGYEGQVLIAQCIRNAAEIDGISVLEVIEGLGYAKPKKASESAIKAVSDVFDKGRGYTAEPILYFYNPDYVSSSWHESQEFILQHNDHKFFKRNGFNE